MKSFSKNISDQELLNDIILVAFSKVYLNEIQTSHKDNDLFTHKLKTLTKNQCEELEKRVNSYLSHCQEDTKQTFQDISDEMLKGFQKVILEVRDIVKFTEPILENAV